MRQHIREVGPITVVTTLILTGDASFEVWAHFIQWDGERHFGVIWTDVIFRLSFFEFVFSELLLKLFKGETIIYK